MIKPGNVIMDEVEADTGTPEHDAFVPSRMDQMRQALMLSSPRTKADFLRKNYERLSAKLSFVERQRVKKKMKRAERAARREGL